MDDPIPERLKAEIDRFREFLQAELSAQLPQWYRSKHLPRELFAALGAGGWFGIRFDGSGLAETSAMREALVIGELAKRSPGAAVAAVAHADLGLMGMRMFAPPNFHQQYGPAAARGETVMCLGNTENQAGSDVAAIQMKAEAVHGGWRLNGTKAYVTNGAVADMAVITAVTDPAAARNRRLSMFLVDLHAPGIKRRKLNKQVWIPSDLTRLEFKDVLIPENHLLGERGRGLQQVLAVFTRSRVPIAALSLGTADGAFELAMAHSRRRTQFGRYIAEFQAKAFEAADLHAHIEAARLMLWEACRRLDSGRDYRRESSLAKYLAVDVARATASWAADIFGAASVMYDHPIHKFPMDAWAASLGEGTQDVQKLIIFRELMKKNER